MQRYFRYLACLIALLVSGTASAFNPTPSNWTSPGGSGGYIYPTAMAACKSYWPSVEFSFSEPGPLQASQECYSQAAGGTLGTVYRQLTCPADSTKQPDGSCKWPKCRAGQNRRFTVPLGWTNSEDAASDAAMDVMFSGRLVCHDGCESNVDKKIYDLFTRPSEPSGPNGKIIYGEFSGTLNGNECVGNTTFPPPPAPPPGDDEPPEDDDNDKEPPGKDCKGENCETTPGFDKPGDPGPGTNPGDTPPGGGKTGPGGGGGIGDPDVPNDNDTEPNCGIGDQPPCNTKIDESGTPRDGGDRMGTERLNHDFTKLDNVLPKIYDRSDKDTTWGVVPSWFGSGSCTPFSFGDIHGVPFTINHCVAVPYAQGAATFMWVVGTFFAVLALVFRSIGGSS